MKFIFKIILSYSILTLSVYGESYYKIEYNMAEVQSTEQIINSILPQATEKQKTKVLNLIKAKNSKLTSKKKLKTGKKILILIPKSFISDEHFKKMVELEKEKIIIIAKKIKQKKSKNNPLSFTPFYLLGLDKVITVIDTKENKSEYFPNWAIRFNLNYKFKIKNKKFISKNNITLKSYASLDEQSLDIPLNYDASSSFVLDKRWKNIAPLINLYYLNFSNVEYVSTVYKIRATNSLSAGVGANFEKTKWGLDFIFNLISGYSIFSKTSHAGEDATELAGFYALSELKLIINDGFTTAFTYKMNQLSNVYEVNFSSIQLNFGIKF